MVLVLDKGKLYDDGKEVRVQVGANIFTLKHNQTIAPGDIDEVTNKYKVMFLSDHVMMR